MVKARVVNQVLYLILRWYQIEVVAQTCRASTQKDEIAGPQVKSQPELCSKTLPQKTKQERKRSYCLNVSSNEGSETVTGKTE